MNVDLMSDNELLMYLILYSEGQAANFKVEMNFCGYSCQANLQKFCCCKNLQKSFSVRKQPVPVINTKLTTLIFPTVCKVKSVKQTCDKVNLWII